MIADKRRHRKRRGDDDPTSTSSAAATTPGHSRSGFRASRHCLGMGSCLRHESRGDLATYSDRSACTTSTRDARAAGISDATTAAPMSTAAAPSDGQRARQLHVLERRSPPRARARSRPPRRRRCRSRQSRAPSDSTRASRCRGVDPTASRTPNSRVRALTENASTPATPTTAIEQRDAGESREHEGVQPLRRQHLRAHVLERRGALHRLVRRQISRMTRVTAGTSAYGSPAACTNRRPASADLRHRVIDRQRRSGHDVLVVHVRHDADDAARLRLAEVADRSTTASGSPRRRSGTAAARRSG